MFDLATEVVSPAMLTHTGVIEERHMPVEADTLTVKTRFGDYEVRRSRVLTLPKGLIGFGEFRSFALLNLPEGKGQHFKLLQAVDESTLGFYVLPVAAETSGLEAADIAEACRQLRIQPKDLMILLVVTARRTDSGVELTANMRAPVLLDSSRLVGHQHVMANDKYPLRHRLN